MELLRSIKGFRGSVYRLQRGTEAWGSAAVSRLLLRDGATGATGFRQPDGVWWRKWHASPLELDVLIAT
jgi:hypothetical protein